MRSRFCLFLCLLLTSATAMSGCGALDTHIDGAKADRIDRRSIERDACLRQAVVTIESQSEESDMADPDVASACMSEVEALIAAFGMHADQQVVEAIKMDSDRRATRFLHEYRGCRQFLRGRHAQQDERYTRYCAETFGLAPGENKAPLRVPLQKHSSHFCSRLVAEGGTAERTDWSASTPARELAIRLQRDHHRG
jgi:hypothetical protein